VKPDLSGGASITLGDLTIGYRQGSRLREVASGLCAEVLRGELTCLLGVNGAGKSTLLRTLSGLQPRLGGEIIIEGKPLDAYSFGSLSRTVGIVTAERAEVRDMSVRDLVGLGRSPHTGFWGRIGRDDERAIEGAICGIKIESLSGRLFHTLSDGERQKVMLAKVLAQETPVILLDEPTAFLDFPSRIEIMRFLLLLAHGHRKTVFLSTHDIELALQVADRLWLLSAEGVLETGTPVELVAGGVIERFFHCDGVEFHSGGRFFSLTGFNP
jgi:iron complex transport system ATP-binding protein